MIVHKNLDTRLRDIWELYGERNAIYLPGVSQRFEFLMYAVGRFMRQLRKDPSDKIMLAKALASVFARTCTFAHGCGIYSVAPALIRKYPRGPCAYCLSAPCICEFSRTPEQFHRVLEGSVLQNDWGIEAWCADLDIKFGKNNRERGIDKAGARLTEEIIEVLQAFFIESKNQTIKFPELQQRIALEFADVYAWILSIIAMLGVAYEVESILERRHGATCTRCGERPCVCGQLSFNWVLTRTERTSQPTVTIGPERRDSEQ